MGNIFAQYYDIGQEPSSLKWKQIRTKNFKLIFPDYYEIPARETALLFEQWRIPVSTSLKVMPSQTPVILHTASLYSNAYTVWAPRRLEFLTIPPQDIYGQSWNEQLVIHEYRHIAQISKMNQGFTRFLGYLFGQQAGPAVIGLFIPSWFMEGDAVATETALSYTGRGRVADFAMPLRALIKEKGSYHYTKSVLGSYKDFVPDEYILGYHLVATSRMKYGTGLWNSALDRTARKPYTLNPFSKGIRKIAGVNKVGLYNQSMNSLDSLWNLSRKLVNYSILQVENQKSYTTYTNPFPVGDKVICLKKSLSDIARFVSIQNDGREKIIYTPGFLFEDEISYNGYYISWAENRPHPRWQTVGFSTIVIYNPEKDEAKKIMTKNRLYAPAVSPDNRHIATAEVTVDGKYYLTLLELNGSVSKRILSPENLFLSSPSWSPDSREIVCLVTGNTGKRIAIYNLADSTFRFLTDYINDEISHPFHAGDRIIFNMDVNQISEVCQLALADGTISLITSSQFGTKFPYYDNGRLLFSVYNSDGYRIGVCSTDQFLMQPVDPQNLNTWPLAVSLGEQESDLARTIVPSDSLLVSQYSKFRNLFYFHSWAPAYIDINDQSVRPGASIMSQNLLSTLFLIAGFDYNPSENTGRWLANISYRALYPQINSTFSYGHRADWEGSGDTAYRYTWKETSWDLGVSQWLSSNVGRYYYGIFAEIKHQLDYTQHTTSTPHNFVQGNIGAIAYRAYFNLLEKSSYRDLAPGTGFSLDFRFKNTIYGDYKAGDLFNTQLRVYLPGLVRNHSLQLYSGFQTLGISSDGYRFAGDVSLPAGYSVRTPDEMIRIRPSYSMPLFYPDWNIGTFFYLKRIRANLFYDYALNLEDTSRYYTAMGVDLITDFHLLALPAPITAGIRAAYLPEADDINVSLIFNLDFTQY